MKAKDVMTERVITVAPDASIVEALQAMLQNRISGLPVVDRAAISSASSPKAISCAGPRPEPSAGVPRWVEFILGPGRSPRTTSTPTPAASTRS